MISFKTFLVAPQADKDDWIAYRKQKRRKSDGVGVNTEDKKGLWYNINQKRKRGEKMRKKGEKGAPTQAAMDRAKGESVKEGEGKYKGETWEQGYKRRVVKTTDPEHKEKGYNWRIKGKERNEISIKLYKNKPSFDEYKKQMKRVAGHEFGG